MFLWKISRLQSDPPVVTATKRQLQCVIISMYTLSYNIYICYSKNYSSAAISISKVSNEEPIMHMSPYEKKRLDNIARNKRKIEEIFGRSRASTEIGKKKRKKSKVHNQYLHNL